ncbi:hypothetical protein BJV82DRAFT_584589 [Fennellomyces sp. T-0311]|nr:hypothetical protein BJV82DRAFT_584589 [Fennellomyces sp. T-0311]
MSAFILIPNEHGNYDAMEGVEYDFILPSPDVLDIFNYPSSDEDEDDDSDEEVEEEEQEEEAETTEEGLLVPDKDDVDYYEEPIDIDDHFHLIEHDYLQANSTDGVQRLVSMTKTSFAHQDPGSTVASTSAGKASTSNRGKRSTPSQAQSSTSLSQVSAPPKRGRGRPRKNPPKEVKNLRGPYKKYNDKLIVKFLETVQNVTLNVHKAAEMKKIEIPYRTALRYWERFTSGEPYLPTSDRKMQPHDEEAREALFST